VAIIYCGTNALLKDIPVQKVRAFEKDFIGFLRDHHSDTLETIRQGVINDEVTAVLYSAAADVAGRYKS
jgi:F-type H+-transporting ATPase subunit alpha